jgi:CRP-like cAMP-binding protein/DNA-binding NarL/FixJ family response regulator
MIPKLALIDSDKEEIFFLNELLYLANYEVIIANNLTSGLSILKSSNLNLILCNIYLPKIEDGLSLFRKYKSQKELRTIPFIFIASKAKKTFIRTIMDLGVDDIISNPKNKIEILKIIKSRLSRVEVFKLENRNSFLYQKPDNVSISNYIKNILATKKIYHFKPNETIYCSGNKSNHIFLIKNGTIKTYRVDDLGKEFITGFFTSDQYFGYTSFIINQPHFENAKALTSTYLYKISKEEIIKTIQKNNHIIFNFMNVIVNDLIKLKKQIVLLAYASVRKKTAETLLNLNQNSSIKKGTAICINRADLADSIGIAKETLIRTLHSFKKEKLIQLSQKSITIIDENKLKKVR